ncbi:MAG: hypothetical protein B6I35_04485 [Anaerolineaceae bacterium 4572_32.2]|nr:MAG: hypothetical protein B6I35_04485 [Anaerolineaceae bacterium 4572_32.2]
MRASVIVTVLNEAGSLSRLLDSLAAQTRLPDEVVVCDGGSTDGTLSLLEAENRLPLRVIRRPGANISQGRNAAIEAATGEIVAVTDAGVRLSRQWIEKIIAPFEDAGTQAVAGFFVPAPQTVFEMAMGATVLPEAREIDPASFNPSSRSVAFRKSAWAVVGGYPEWLDYCEDLIFDFRLRERLGPFLFAPEALVHFRPRSNLRTFFIQYYRYARGDGKADLWRRRHAIRYLTYLVATPQDDRVSNWVVVALAQDPQDFNTGGTMTKTEREKSVLSSNGVRKLLEDGGESLTEDERALLLAMLSVEAETGGSFSEEERAALDELTAKLKSYDAGELTQAVKRLVTAKPQAARKLEWPELKRERR